MPTPIGPASRYESSKTMPVLSATTPGFVARSRTAGIAFARCFQLSPIPIFSPRNTVGDVGTQIAAFDESLRRDLDDVLAANCKRIGESLRTLEEYAKIEAQDAGRQLERLLRLLHRRVHPALGPADRLFKGRYLYWLADPDQCLADFTWTVEEMLAGGVQVLQLRDKTGTDREMVDLARFLAKLCLGKRWRC